jgi:hypothetical protein
VGQVLQDMVRLLPAGMDCEALQAADPGWLTRVERGQRRLGQHPD